MDRIPIVRMGRALLATITGEIEDSMALGAVGLTLVELGLSLPGVGTALDGERGTAALARGWPDGGHGG